MNKIGFIYEKIEQKMEKINPNLYQTIFEYYLKTWLIFFISAIKNIILNKAI